MQSASNDLEVFVSELQKKFDRLKVLYEQYFMGIEKIEPQTARKEISRAILSLQQMHLRNTGLRFKVATLIQKWNIYQGYWNRTIREIEAGRYVRHVATARRRAEQQGLEFPAEEMGLHLPPHPAPALRPADRARPAEAQRQPPAPDGHPPAAGAPLPPIPGMSSDEIQALHRRIVEAQQMAGETTLIRFDALVAQLARQVPKLMDEHGCTEVKFEVVTRDGRVRLKPKPVK
jgi:hypothetical protein